MSELYYSGLSGKIYKSKGQSQAYENLMKLSSITCLEGNKTIRNETEVGQQSPRYEFELSAL